MSTPYSPTVMDHFHTPRNAHRMQAPDRVGTAGTPGRGPFVVLYLQVAGGRIVLASFQTYGCAPAIAAASLLCERLPGTTLEQATQWTAAAIEAALGGLPPHKRHCAALAASALTSAVERPCGLASPRADALGRGPNPDLSRTQSTQE